MNLGRVWEGCSGLGSGFKHKVIAKNGMIMQEEDCVEEQGNSNKKEK